MQKFFMVYVDGRTGSTCKHPDLTSAYEEAERLARQPQNRDKRVFILEAVFYCITDCPPVRWEIIL